MQQPTPTQRWWNRLGRRFWRGAMAVLATVLVAILLAVLAGVFQQKVPDTTPSRSESAASAIQQATAHIIRRPRYETAVGTVEPVHQSAIASKLLARVVEADVKAGQTVQEGDVLIKLDDADLQARLRQAEAAADAARARRDQAQTDFDRAASLLAKKAVSQAAYDQAASALKTASSDLERAEQAVAEASVLLDHAMVRAPMSGVIVDKRVEAGDTVTPGQNLVTLYDPTRMQLVAAVRESLAQRLKVGQPLLARLEALDHECQATISEIVPAAESASRSFSVKVTGPCPPGVYSGMFGRLLIPL